MISEAQAVVFSVLPSTIPVIAWIVAVVFAVKMVRNGGGRPERFLLIGVCLMLASSVVGFTLAGLNPWLTPRLVEARTNPRIIGLIFSAINLVGGLISLAGIILLVYAFWRKFKADSITAA